MTGTHERILEFDPVQVSDCRAALACSARFDRVAAEGASIVSSPRYTVRGEGRHRLFSLTGELFSGFGTLVFASEFELDRLPYDRWDRDALSGQLEVLETIVVGDQFVADARW